VNRETFGVRIGEGRSIPFIGLVKVSGARSRGAVEVIEYIGPATPPPHIHREHDECFVVLEGHFDFTIDGKPFPADIGDIAFVPRGTAHGFKIVPGSRALLIVVPGGMEGFFVELGDGLAAGRSADEIRAALAGKYDSSPVQ